LQFLFLKKKNSPINSTKMEKCEDETILSEIYISENDRDLLIYLEKLVTSGVLSEEEFTKKKETVLSKYNNEIIEKKKRKKKLMNFSLLLKKKIMENQSIQKNPFLLSDQQKKKLNELKTENSKILDQSRIKKFDIKYIIERIKDNHPDLIEFKIIEKKVGLKELENLMTTIEKNETIKKLTVSNSIISQKLETELLLLIANNKTIERYFIQIKPRLDIQELKEINMEKITKALKNNNSIINMNTPSYTTKEQSETIDSYLHRNYELKKEEKKLVLKLQEIELKKKEEVEEAGSMTEEEKTKFNKESLLEWTNQILKMNKYPFGEIKNFDKDFEDGNALVSILSHYHPDLVDLDSVQDNDPEDNVHLCYIILEEIGMDTGNCPEDYFGIDDLFTFLFIVDLKKFFVKEMVKIDYSNLIEIVEGERERVIIYS
jgi:hypothetical protein